MIKEARLLRPGFLEKRCSMRYKGNIWGIWINNKHVISHKFFVQYTSDEIGKSLSIGNEQTGEMFQIPFDELYKIITKK